MLFARDGFEQTTTRQIAKRARIATGTLFLYFPDKRALLLHLFRTEIEGVTNEAFAAVSDRAPLTENLFRVFERFYDYFGQDPRLSRVFAKELMFLDEPERSQLALHTVGMLSRIAEVITAAQRRGELNAHVEPFQAACQCVTVYWMGLLAWLGGTIPTREALQIRLRASLDLLMKGMSR